MGGRVRQGAGKLGPTKSQPGHAALLLSVPWLRTGDGHSRRPKDGVSIPLLGRGRHRGLENPLLPLPAVLAVAVGFFVPLAVLIVYSFWPTEDGQIIHRWTT